MQLLVFRAPLTDCSQIPLLLLVLGAWIRNYVPWIWDGVTDSYDFVKARATQRAVELGI